MSQIKAWIHAFRLRTLPLSFSSIILGSFLAAVEGYYKWAVLALALVTTLCLQILSNLANDYGDSEKGTDNDDRQGPTRAIQSGMITPSQMRMMIRVFVGFSMLSGIGLLTVSFKSNQLPYVFFFLVLGGAAIWAAIKYTMGENAYGYRGLGDLFVFLFFGLTGVIGSFYLQAHHISLNALLGGVAIGCFSVGVLNVNNMRDRENDAKSGKRTLPVILGSRLARLYHSGLILGGWVCAVLIEVSQAVGKFHWAVFLLGPFFFLHIRNVFKDQPARMLDPELKRLSLLTLAFSLLMGLDLVF